MIHKHHRQRRKEGDDRPVNILLVPDDVHDWIHKNPEKARELGWIVPTWENPENVSVQIVTKLEEEKPKRARFKDEEKRVRKTVTVRVPKDAKEDGAGIMDDLVEQLEEIVKPESGARPIYYTLVDALNFALMWVHDNPEEG